MGDADGNPGRVSDAADTQRTSASVGGLRRRRGRWLQWAMGVMSALREHWPVKREQPRLDGRDPRRLARGLRWRQSKAPPTMRIRRRGED